MSLTLKQLKSSCLADWRFFRNSLMDFNGTQHLSTHSLGQGVALGTPCVTIDNVAHYANVPFNFAASTDYAWEFLLVPQQINTGGQFSYLWGTGSDYIALDHAAGARRARSVLGGGALAQSSSIDWVPGQPMHLVVVHWSTGITAFFFQGEDGNGGGAGGVAAMNNSALFNYGRPANNTTAGFGHWFRVRIFGARLDQSDARYLFQEAQNILPQVRFPIWTP